MELVRYCKALSDETRVRLMALLMRHELNVGEIVQAVAMGQSRVSRHLKILLDAGLVEVRRDGLWAFYSAVDDGRPRVFLDGASAMLEDEVVIGTDLARAEEVLRERVESTREFFDAVAENWDSLARDVLGDLNLASEITGRLGQVKVAADLGCGSGDLLAELAEKSLQVIGVDNSQKMLDTARTRFASDHKLSQRISLRIGELPHLPLRDWEADFAVLSMVLHHLSNPEIAISEAGRVLKMGGKLVVADFDRHTNETMRTVYGDHRLGIAQSEMEGWLARARFNVQNVAVHPVNMGLSVLVYECVRK